MNTQITVHFQTTASAAQASAAGLLHSQAGGLLLKPGPAERSSGEREGGVPPLEDSSPLEDLYCRLMASAHGGIVDVPTGDREVVLAFIKTRRAVLTELKTVVISVSPDPGSQQAALQTLDALRAAGVNATDMRLLFTDAPGAVAIGDIYPAVMEYAQQAQIAVSPEAVLPGNIPFAKLRHFRIPVAAVLNRVVDYEAELTAARFGGAPEKIIYTLAHKVIAQRDLLDATGAVKHIASTLGLQCISPEAWRAEALPASNRKRSRAATAE